MLVGQYEFIGGDWALVAGDADPSPQLILAFFSAAPSGASKALLQLREMFPRSHVAACTTGGEILGPRLLTDSFVATSVSFKSSHVHSARCSISSRQESTGAGQQIGSALAAPDLRGVLILADGLDTNGSHLVRGVRECVGDDVELFGGLAGDGMDFTLTRVACNGDLTSGSVAGVGFYGTSLRISHGSASGWTPVGRPGQVTNSSGSILYEIDGHPALDWLCHASDLRADAGVADLMLQPIWISDGKAAGSGVIRFAVGLDSVRGSLMLAGGIPEEGRCHLLQADSASLVEGASTAARLAGGARPPALAVLVSCLGRRVALGARADQEVAAVAAALGHIPQIGFHSYGEIGRMAQATCDFHNQTMSVTVLSEED